MEFNSGFKGLNPPYRPPSLLSSACQDHILSRKNGEKAKLGTILHPATKYNMLQFHIAIPYSEWCKNHLTPELVTTSKAHIIIPSLWNSKRYLSVKMKALWTFQVFKKCKKRVG